MNINLKLKERRDKINEILRHKRTKVARKFKQAKKEFKDENLNNPDDVIKSKIEKYQNVEKMINNFDRKIGAEEENKNENIEVNKNENRNENRNKNQKNPNRHKNDNNIQENNKNRFSKNTQVPVIKKTPEEREKEKKIQFEKRKKAYRNLNKKTPKGQPVMKFQVEHIFKKIKTKINKGLI